MRDTIAVAQTDDQASTGAAPLRLAVIDTDTGFLQVLGKRLERLGLGAPRPRQRRRRSTPSSPCGSAPSSSTSRSSGRRRWEYLERSSAPRCRGSASSSAPASRPSPSACAACASAPTTGSPSRAIPRSSSRGSRRSCAAAGAAEARADAAPVVAGEVEIRADQFQAFVDGRSIDLTRREFELIELLAGARRPRARARGDLPARLGLRDGPRRPLGRRLRPQAAPEAREGLAASGATSTRTSASGYRFAPEPADGVDDRGRRGGARCARPPGGRRRRPRPAAPAARGAPAARPSTVGGVKHAPQLRHRRAARARRSTLCRAAARRPSSSARAAIRDPASAIGLLAARLYRERRAGHRVARRPLAARRCTRRSA